MGGGGPCVRQSFKINDLNMISIQSKCVFATNSDFLNLATQCRKP